MRKVLTAVLSVLALTAFTASSLEAKSVPAYYTAQYKDVKSAKSAIKRAGLHTIATYHPVGKSYLTTILYTGNTLKKLASKPKRGFAAIQRVLVNSKKKTLLVANPEYWLRAFLQSDYKNGSEAPVKNALKKAFGKMTPTKDALSSGKLAKYHFMIGMPYYDEMIVLKKGEKLSVSNRVFSLSLGNGTKIYGVKMPKSVEKFVSVIGEDKALVLPYMVMVEHGKALMLAPKYYLAVSYPRLSMGQFMKISNTPSEIESALKRSVK